MNSRSQVWFEVEGRQLRADVLVPKGGEQVPFVLFLQDSGKAGADPAMYTRSLARRGVGTFSVDLRGQGEGLAGEPTLSHEECLQAVLAAYDACFELPQSDATAVFVVGESYGGYIAALLAAERPLAGVVLRAPVLHPDSEWHNQALASLRQSRVPVLVVSSEKDEFTPKYAIMSYLAAASGPRAHYLIAGAHHHLNSRERRQFDRVLTEWLEGRMQAPVFG